MVRFPITAVMLVACSSDVDDVLVLDADRFDVTVDGATFSDAFPNPLDTTDDVARFNGGGPFQCGDCVCDGTLYYCGGGGSGGLAPLDLDASSEAEADAQSCTPDAYVSYAHCIRIPIECLPKPSCECLLPDPGTCWCDVDPTGNGLSVACMPRP